MAQQDGNVPDAVQMRRKQTHEDLRPETGPFQEMIPGYADLQWAPIKAYLDNKFKEQNWTEYNEIYV
jgi:hypothetical protein